VIYKFNRFEEWIVIPLFPLYKTKKANDRIFKDIEELQQLDRLTPNGSYMGNYITLSVCDARIFLEKTLDKKKSLEDKAKTNVFGVTIAVTLVTGLSKVLIDWNSLNYPIVFKMILFLIAFYVLIQMILAGLSSIKIIGDIIIQYELFPDDVNLPDNDLLDLIALDTEINVKYNTIRNNYLSSSYESLKKSLIGLLILFIIITFPFNIFVNNNSLQQDKMHTDIINIQHQQMELEKRVELLKDTQITQSSKINDIEKISKIEQQIKVLNQEISEMKSSISDIKK